MIIGFALGKRMSPFRRSDALKIIFAWAALSLVLNLAWEIVQLPLYEIPSARTTAQIAYAVAHCTAGDILIASASFLIAALALGDALAMTLLDWKVHGAAYAAAMRSVHESKCHRIGLRKDWNAWEYPLWVLAEELDGHGMLIVMDAEELARGPLVAVLHPEARHHLGHDEPGPVPLGLEPHEPVADARQRGEHDAVGNANRADLERVGERRRHAPQGSRAIRRRQGPHPGTGRHTPTSRRS